MHTTQQQAVLAIALHAAFADGAKHDREREAIRRIADSLASEAGAVDLARLYQDVLLRRTKLETAAAALTDPGERQLAYEMAACVCDADGPQTEAERRFLDELKALLELDAGEVSSFEREAGAIVDFSEAVVPAAVAGGPKVSEAETDKTILNYALLTGALELLPQSWASLAIIPLQIRMVYGIGKAHGYALDQGHVKDFIAAAGVGLTSQYLEQFGRKLLGGLIGKAAGGLAGRIGGAGAGMAFSFATTYALGQVAKRYYAGGRKMTAAVLRDTFQDLLGPAKEMQARYLPQIRQTAGGMDAARVMALVREGAP